MVISDLEVKQSLLKKLNASKDELVAMIVERHLNMMPQLRMKMAIWLNAKEEPWQNGVTLLQICKNVTHDPHPDFRPQEFSPAGGWPRIRVIITRVTELNVDVELAHAAQEQSFVEEVIGRLKSGEAHVVFPLGASPEAFEKLLEKMD